MRNLHKLNNSSGNGSNASQGSDSEEDFPRVLVSRKQVSKGKFAVLAGRGVAQSKWTAFVGGTASQVM